jgi:galactose-1-phosphate uridylyltransferase
MVGSRHPLVQFKLRDNKAYKIFDNDIYHVHQIVLEYCREGICGLSNSGTAVLLGS